MNKSGFSYLKMTAFVTVLVMTLIGLSGLLSMTTTAQGEIEKVTAPDREIDLRSKLKDKKFTDGRRVTIETLASGEKIVAEVKDGKFKSLFLVATDGSEVQGVVKKKATTKYTDTSTCTMTTTTTTTHTNRRGKQTVTSSSTVVQIPCPLVLDGDTFKQ